MFLLPVVVGAALAAEPSELWLATDRQAVAVEPAGSLCASSVGIGLLWDPDGPSGSAPIGGDLLMQGRAFETWSLTWSDADGDHHTVAGFTAGDAMDALTWEAPVEGRDVGTLRGAGEVGPLDVQLSVDQPWRDDNTGLVFLTVEVAAAEAVEDLWITRTYDPDPDAWSTGSNATLNTVEDGAVAGEGQYDARTLALAAADGIGGTCSWCTAPDELVDTGAPEAPADDQLGVAVEVGSLAAGEGAQVVFVYALASDTTSALQAAGGAAAAPDRDGDGWTESEGDCDDRSTDAAPDLAEWADGVDNDCDGAIDEETSGEDADGDGFSPADGDCDDTDADVFPGASPIDGVVDADCDGTADDGAWGQTPADDVDGTVGVGSTRGDGCAAAPPPDLGAMGLLCVMGAALGRRRRTR